MNTTDKVLLISNNWDSVYLSKDIVEKFYLPENIIVRDNSNESLIYLDYFVNNNFGNLLILLDLQMPDAFHFLQEFEKRHYKNIFIGILTDLSNADDIVRLRETGNYYSVVKPLCEDSFLNMQHKYFRKYAQLTSF
jgi:DNA-binding response OmpR family regulator